MKDISENELLRLGFKKNNVNPEESGDNTSYHYYTLDINDRCFLISCASDECINGFYKIEVFDFSEIGTFTDVDVLYDFIKIIKSLTKNY